MDINKRKIGSFYEEKAASFLRSKGLSIREKNYRCRMGEVDLIAQDGDCFVFVEVKYRHGSRTGFSMEAVDWRKQRVLTKVAQYYLLTHVHTMEVPCRFDVVGIDGDEIHWIPNAFDAC